MTAATRRVTVLGVGNELMCDDGVGVTVARALQHRGALPPGIDVVLGETAGMALVRHFRESDAVVFVDAIDVGERPGSIFRFHPDDAGVTSLRSNNTHGMGIGYLLTCARLAGADPDVTVVAVQVGDVRPLPDQLTPQVADAIPDALALVEQEALRFLHAHATPRGVRH